MEKDKRLIGVGECEVHSEDSSAGEMPLKDYDFWNKFLQVAGAEHKLAVRDVGILYLAFWTVKCQFSICQVNY